MTLTRSTGKANIAIVLASGGQPEAVLTALMVRAGRGSEPRLRQRGNGRFDRRTLEHLESTVLHVSDRILNSLGLRARRYEVTLANTADASLHDAGTEVCGFSADAPALLAIVSEELKLPVPDKVLATGQLTTDGSVLPVKHQIEKLNAAMASPHIETFIYADLPHDGVASAAARGEADAFYLAARQAQDYMLCVPVTDVAELLKAAFPESDVLLAMLSRAKETIGECTSSDVFGEAARFLGDDRDPRLWAEFRRMLIEREMTSARSLLRARLIASIRDGRFPADIGTQLTDVMRGLPRHVRADRSLVPLMQPDDYWPLIRLADDSQAADAALLLDAVRGRGWCASCQQEPGGFPNDAPFSPEGFLAWLRDQVSPSSLVTVAGTVDEARATYPIKSVRIENTAEFWDEMASFTTHLLTHCEGLCGAEAHGLPAEVVSLLERAFRSDGGVDAAIREALEATRGGLRLVMDRLTETYRRELLAAHLSAILKNAVSHLGWEDKVATSQHIIETVQTHLASEHRSRRPEELAADLEAVLRAYIDTCHGLRNILYATDRR